MYFDSDVSGNVAFPSRILAVCAHAMFHEYLVIAYCLHRHQSSIRVAAVCTLISVQRHKQKRFTVTSNKSQAMNVFVPSTGTRNLPSTKLPQKWTLYPLTHLLSHPKALLYSLVRSQFHSKHLASPSPQGRTPSVTEAFRMRSSLTPQTFPKFWELPAEIRLKIYYHVLVMDKPILPTEVQPLKLLQTCHLVYNEASEEPYYQYNTFIVGHSVREEIKWLDRIGAKRRQMIRKVEVLDAPGKTLGLKMFDLLSQCSGLSLTMEISARSLAQYFDAGRLTHLHGVSKVTIEHLCKDHQTKSCIGQETEDQKEGQTQGETESRTKGQTKGETESQTERQIRRQKEQQQSLWEYWVEVLEEVKGYLESSCAPTCLFHVNKDRLGPESSVHLRITHCCRQKHCCDPEWFNV